MPSKDRAYAAPVTEVHRYTDRARVIDLAAPEVALELRQTRPQETIHMEGEGDENRWAIATRRHRRAAVGRRRRDAEIRALKQSLLRGRRRHLDERIGWIGGRVIDIARRCLIGLDVLLLKNLACSF